MCNSGHQDSLGKRGRRGWIAVQKAAFGLGLSKMPFVFVLFLLPILIKFFEYVFQIYSKDVIFYSLKSYHIFSGLIQFNLLKSPHFLY